MTTVACVYRSGGLYDASWVDRLRDGVRRHMGEHRFACLTDQPETMDGLGIAAIPLVQDWPGWWSKIELFRPGLFDGPTLYIDLDSLITGRLDDLVRTEPGFTMVADYNGATRGWHNSSVMSWCDDYSAIYREFAEQPVLEQDRYSAMPDGRIGDQAFIEDTLTMMGERIDTFRPGRVVSFKRHARQAPPPGARVVQFHGRPKPNEASGWPQKAWSHHAGVIE